VIPVDLRTEAGALLRHYPLPYELISAALLVPDLLAEPAVYFTDTRTPNTVRTAIELLCLFDPELRVVVDGPDDAFVDLPSIGPLWLSPAPRKSAQDNDHENPSGSDVEPVVWITGSRSCHANRPKHVYSDPATRRP
jgi:hypothetical protein